MKVPFDPERFADDRNIDRRDLSNAFANQASLFAHYAEQHAAMMRQEANAKLRMELAHAKAYRAARDAAAVEKVKMSEAQLEAEVMRNTAYIRAVYAYNEAKSLTALAHGAVEAFKQRRDMLIQLGANERKEMEGEVRMNFTADRASTLARIRESLQRETETASKS